MSYLILIIICIIIARVLIKKTFYWETVIKFLWKQIYQLSYLMALDIKSGVSETTYVSIYKERLDSRGNLINAIINYVNSGEKDEDEDVEENTFNYGRYDFVTILMLAKSNPETFKKLK